MITCYSPVRHATHPRVFTFDLHASSTPPTFVLSQDQTLHFMYVQNIAASLQDTRHRVLFGYLSLNRSEPPTPRRSLTACYGRLTYPQRTSQTTEVAAKLSRIGLIKKLTRFFFRGHPKCQRSSQKVSEARCWGRGTLATLTTTRKQLSKDFSHHLQIVARH